MRPDAKRLYEIYLAWKESVAEISDVEGLYPTFVMNIMPKSSLSVAKNNGVGNVWGMNDDQSYISMEFSLSFYTFRALVLTLIQSGKPPLDGRMLRTTSEVSPMRIRVRCQILVDGMFTCAKWTCLLLRYLPCLPLDDEIGLS